MSCCGCFGSGKSSKKGREGVTLSSFVRNISFRSDASKQKRLAEEILQFGDGNVAAQIFTFQELDSATNSFNDECLLGEGGFGRVYKAHIEGRNQDVAVKRLDKKGLQGNSEFLVEVLMLSLLHHPNLVNLIGYCATGGQRILVYEFMPLGSLEDHLLAQIAQPLFKDRSKFSLMADPLLEGKYPLKGLYQALAIAAMCLQEEANTRPFIADVVTALEYLSVPTIDEEGTVGTPRPPSTEAG
ncbi:hypothetical protein Syun_026999 [Stephania yunnanensis]|uniref:Protein kinase domain-containing protein n=1 Tax=Stephania yunnanensis TaxID=152371 RepID=A0AAP0EKA1_9MAGN